MGGVKVGHSKPRLPLYVDVYQVKVSDEMIRMLNERFLLIYTGKTRLAKNLLQVKLVDRLQSYTSGLHITYILLADIVQYSVWISREEF